MNKNSKILYMLLFIGVFSACEDKNPIGEIPLVEPEISYSTSTRGAGYGPYDALGYGYDCAYSDLKGSDFIRKAVIDVNKCLTGKGTDPLTGNQVNVTPLTIDSAIIHQGGNSDETWGYNFNEYKESMNNATNISVSVGKGKINFFTAELKNYYTDSIRYSQVYSFYRLDAIKTVRKLSFSHTLPDELKYFLNDNFISDTKNLSAKTLIERYGTHVLTDIRLGGMGSIFFNARLNSSSSTNKFKLDAKAVYSGITAQTNYAIEKNRFQDFRDVHIHIHTIGGSEPIAQSSIKFDAEKSQLEDLNFDYVLWLKGVSEKTEEIIGTGNPNTVIYPISEFIFDPIKKIQVEQAIIDYVNSNAIHMKQIDIIDNKNIAVYNRKSTSSGGGGRRSVSMAPHLRVKKKDGKEMLYIATRSSTDIGLLVFIPYGEYYQISYKGGNNYLDFSDKTFKPFNNNPNQLWTLEYMNPTTFKIRNVGYDCYLGFDLDTKYRNSDDNDEIIWYIPHETIPYHRG
ncbi:MAG: MAC/perforin domain-containing protein [Dysgonamonadaceae bacterium]|jgi:hypothetical protein|nr:MAC/perforin domain-containing protein [Dysgonamonadaceae bacterium]MDD4378977.1 MAC/perforin domain-containing protein [Dysgonamonadaceae bacterium]